MKNSLITLLLLSVLISLAISHYDDAAPCTHTQDQAESPPELLDVEEDFSSLQKDRVLASASYNPIRIKAYYDVLSSESSTSYTSYVQNDLAPAVISYFEGALKVKYPVAGNLKLATSSICGFSTPSELKNGVAADYAIIFSAYSKNNNVVASSKYCFLAAGSKRPLIATTKFNKNMFLVANGDVILHEKNTYLLLHEMTHTFGFSTTMYNHFLGSDGKTLKGHVKSVKIAGNTHTVVDVSPLTEKLRAFHGCSSIPGAIMEDDGGSGTDGSHFEKKFYIFETMATGSSTGKRTSELSLAMLESSGWYEVDYSYAEPYFYGQGQGCDFINGQCSGSKPAFDEFCTGGTKGCAFVGHSGGSCYNDGKTNGCRYINPSNNHHCENPGASRALGSAEVYGRGLGSKCFTGSLSTKSSSKSGNSYCFTYDCVGSGSNTQLEVKIGGNSVTCTKEGSMSVSGYKGTIDCPDPLTFCSTVGVRFCPRNCMGRGKCVNNQCQCDSGFTGVDCALRA